MLKTAGSSQGLFSSYEVIQGFSINKKEYSHDFLIVKSLNLPPIAVILGFDLISKFKFVIKAQERMKIILDGQVIPTVLSPSVTINVVASEREVCSYLLCTQDIVIPKCSVMCVKLKVVGKSLLEGTSVIVIPNQEFSYFLSFDIITKVSDGFVCVVHFNSLNKPKQILAKTALARCEPVINTEHVASVSVYSVMSEIRNC